MASMYSSALRKIATLSLLLMLGAARAQDSEPLEADPPDRAARLSLIRGEVSMQPAGEEEWAPALLNRPLTTGDRLWTAPGARAEIQVGQAVVRLAETTGFSFLNVDDDTIQMRMTAGVLSIRVRALDDNDEIEIDTPNLAVTLLRPGSYRVEVNDAGDATVVKVNEGEAEVDGPSQNVVVRSRESATFRGTDRLAADFGPLGASDEFDSWSLDRDRGYDRVASSRTAEYVSPDVTGYEDLDDNGTWNSEPEYGYVWTPRNLAVDWSPYRFGRWVWVTPWGWTWIDDAPWGYAPFHYGRWAHVRQRWCWVPGPRHVRAVYAPALVGWVDRPGVSVAISSGRGGVGWFPLGPREVYVPRGRYSRRYVERVNLTNTTVGREFVREMHENRARNVNYRNRGAVTVVTQTTFTSARRVGDHRVRDGERDIGRTRLVAGAPHIEPLRESRLGGAPRAPLRAPSQTIVNRQVVVRRNPPPSSAHFTRTLENRSEAPRASSDRARDRNLRDREIVVRDRLDRRRHVEQPASVGRTREDRPRADRPSRELMERQEQLREQQVRQQQDRQQQARDVRPQRAVEVQQHQRQQESPPRVTERQVEQRERVIERQVEQRQRVERPQTERQQQPSRSEQKPAQPQSQRESQPQHRSNDNTPRQRRN